MQTRELDCTKCGRATEHGLTRMDDGRFRSSCLRCRDIDAEARRLVEAQSRDAEIAHRARQMTGERVAWVNSPANPAVKAEIARNKQKAGWPTAVVCIVIGALLFLAGEGDPLLGFERIWTSLVGGR